MIPDELHNTDGRRFYNTLQKCECWLKRNFSIEQLFNATLNISRFAYWKWENLSLNSPTSFLTKSDRISLETSWLLKFEILRVSVSINFNISRHLDQVSHRNNQLLPFFNFLTWYEVWYPSSDIPLRIYKYPSGRRSWILTPLPGPHELY